MDLFSAKDAGQSNAGTTLAKADMYKASSMQRRHIYHVLAIIDQPLTLPRLISAFR